MQIKTRLTLNFLSIVLPILGISFVAIYFAFESYRREEFATRLLAKASTTADLFFTVEQVDSSLLRLIDKKKRDILFREHIQILRSDLKPVYQSGDRSGFSLDLRKIQNLDVGQNYEFDQGLFEIIVFRYNWKKNEYFIVAGAIDKFGLSKLQFLRNTLVLSFLFGSLIIVITGYFFAGRTLRPISLILSQMRGFSPTNLNARLTFENNRDELSRLSQTINNLLSRIESAFKLQKSFVANASHELKNPLAVITSQIEVGLLNPRDNTEYQRILKSLLHDIRSINDIVDRLMDLAQIESGSVDFKFIKVFPDEIVMQAKEDFEKLNPNAVINLEILSLPDDDNDLMEQGNERLLKMAFFNLIENAWKFSDANSVKVIFKHISGQNTLEFVNPIKPGSEFDVNRIFEPFQRGSLSHSIKGHGIGLFLVKKISQIHRCEIEADVSHDKRIITFTWRFPVK